MSQKYNQFRPAILLMALLLIMISGCRRQAEPAPTAGPTAAPLPSPTPTALPATAAPTVPAETSADEASVSEEVRAELVDVQWVLVTYGDLDAPAVVMEDTLVTLLFGEDGTVTGYGGCNNYSGSYEITASGTLSIGPVATSLAICERGMEQEQAFLAALPTARQLGFDEQDRLQIDYEGAGDGDGGVMTFVRGSVPLAGTPWTLIAFGDAEAPARVEAGTAITAFFTETDETQGTVTGFGGCNEYTAAYTRGEGTLQVRNPASTLRGCPLGVNQENNYLTALATTHTYRILGQRLEVEYDGGVLIYRASGLPLTNVLWRLVAVDGQSVPDNTPITLAFLPGEEAAGGQVRGTAGCATYQSTYERAEGELSVAPAQVTGELCSEPFAYEGAFLEALATATGFAIYGEQMGLETADGLLAFAAHRAPLERVAWELVSFGPLLNPQSLPEGASMRALFVRSPDRPSGLMVGETACNAFSAAYAASVEEIGINQPVRTAGQACTARQLAQEEEIFQILTSAGKYRILGNSLQIGSGDEALNFSVAQEGAEDTGLRALDGTTWYLLSLYDQPVRDGTQITAAFTIDAGGVMGTVGGSAGCNSYSAQINGDLDIGPVVTSRQACASPPSVMEQEAAYLAALSAVESHTLSTNQLLLTTPDGVIVYASQPAHPSTDQSALLRDVRWYLQSYGTTPASGGGNGAVITFDAQGSVTGSTGCNSFSGSYSTSARQIQIGTLAVTQAACAEPLASQERYMLSTLQGAQSYLIASSQLQIQSESGVLNFTSVPPAEDEAGAELVAVMQAPTSTQVGQAITFDATSSIHTRPIIKFLWNFGDGGRASGPVVAHAYSSEGTFVAELLISDDRGTDATTTQQIVVSAAGTTPPMATISGPASAQVKETVTFSASGSNTGGGGGPLRHTWYFGDGATVDSGTAAEVSYVYGVPGVYQVSVLITAGDGSSDSASTSITISGGLEQTSWVWGNGPAPITIRFAGGTVTGFAGCNNYNATYTLQGNQINITQPFAGDNQCPQEVMEQEQQFLTALPQATSFQIDGNTLTLTGSGGQSALFYAQN